DDALGIVPHAVAVDDAAARVLGDRPHAAVDGGGPAAADVLPHPAQPADGPAPAHLLLGAADTAGGHHHTRDAELALAGLADGGHEPHAEPVHVGALLPGGELHVGLGPLPRPVVLALAVEAGRAHPVLKRQVVGVLDAHAPLFRAVDQEDPAERPERLPSQV